MSSDGVTIKNDANTLLFTDDEVSDNFYAFEKSYYGVISEEMVNFFASLVEFNDLVGQPIDGYKRSYKEMEKLAGCSSRKPRVASSPKDFDFYKWIDSSITFALTQLFPLPLNTRRPQEILSRVTLSKETSNESSRFH